MGTQENLTYFARGCFLEGTEIATPDGYKLIETLRAGDKVISFNEITGAHETSKIGSIDVLEKPEYYIINNSVKVTGEHPFYTNKGIVEVQNFDSTHKLIQIDGNEVMITSYRKVQEPAVVYNLLDVKPNNNYFAADYLVHNKGGGCFLKGTKVTTPYGNKAIQKLKVGDLVISHNDSTNRTETSNVAKIDVLKVQGYYMLNNNLKVTGTHPMYTTKNGTRSEVKIVSELMIGDNLVTDAGWQRIWKIEYIDKEVTVYNLIDVSPNHNYYANNYLVHNKGGGGGRGGGGGGRSSSSHSSSKSSSSSKSIAPAKPKAGTSDAKPGSKIKTADGKEVQTSAKAPSNKKFTSSKGVVGDNGYTPKFSNGYSAPAGSVVYYRDNNISDYLFWAYLFNNDNPARPENQQATIVQPDGKEVIAKPEPQGVDGMMVFNWIIFILVISAVIAGIVYLVHKLTSKEPPKKTGYYGNW